MNARAVIFDVYGTLLQVDPPPPDAAAGWAALWQEALSMPPRLTLPEFAQASDAVIAREHAAARAMGILHPEIFWPDIVIEVLPELAHCSAAVRGEFMFRHAALSRTVGLMVGAADTLRWLCGRRILLGIASNAQPYTLRELDHALAQAGLARDLFVPELCFWSFAHGFSKPNPHVFRLLTARLQAHGVAASEILMVGDRLDNDVAPACAQGWRAWRLTAPSLGSTGGAGDWSSLAGFLAQG
jgi:FMN phosphatase YigB (HAD superfamily)